MNEAYDVAQAKGRLSELFNRAAFGRERFVIRKRGKPFAAIVSVSDLDRLEETPRRKRGLIVAAGLLGDLHDLEEGVEQAQG